jgi:hypothetical protein
MNNEVKRLHDIVTFGNFSEIKKGITSNMSMVEKLADFIRKNLDRTERNYVLYCILGKVKSYLYTLVRSLEGPTEQLAFISRSFFELNLIVRYVLMNEENLKRFVAESAVDRIEVYKGILELPEANEKDNAEQAKVLRKEIARINELAEKYKLDYKGHISMKDIAKKAGLEVEYKALYKLFSKYVHPSSYTITMRSEDTHSLEMRNIFLIHAQLYAGYVFQCIKESLEKDGGVGFKIT